MRRVATVPNVWLRRIALVAVALGIGSAAGCGGTDRSATSGSTGANAPITSDSAAAPNLQRLLGLDDDVVSSPDVLMPGGADLPAGKRVRLPFLLLDKGGEPLRLPAERLTVWVADDAKTPAHGPFQARSEAIEAPGAALHDHVVEQIWVAWINVPDAGPHFVAVTYEGRGGPSAASAGVEILARESTPAVGQAAPRSDTPTLADVDGDAAALSTADRPIASLLEHSVADSLADHAPFVVVFATPKFCTSRLCGPVVDIVARVQTTLAATSVRFIHVEIYAENDPSKGPNEWVQQWGLPTEPWVFVVGADGRIAAKFEGAVSERELEEAARTVLAAP